MQEQIEKTLSEIENKQKKSFGHWNTVSVFNPPTCVAVMLIRSISSSAACEL